jgi:hypothetical protein
MAIPLVSDNAPAAKCVPCYLDGTFDYVIEKSCGTVGLLLLGLIGERSDVEQVSGPARQSVA